MPLLPNKKKNTSNDDMNEITKGISELSINKAIAKGIEADEVAVDIDNISVEIVPYL
ncbi:6723_t:CDS:2 [Acaulospora morrowiae]|uniref:6723_t:CDS:1 n=1 Tax=Acaulospora morrowiae TaxID=94023 RepID=A0A9N8V4S9_9GLOM|nr:6723_t:CDS:2 [Acaulospora morrowiae]